MATHLPRGVASTCAAPGLIAYVLDDAGLLVAPFELGFRVYDASTAELREAPTQVWPADPNDEVAVDLDLCADGGHGLGVGRYVAAFTPAATWRTGRYEIEWRLQLVSGGVERRWREPFDLLATTLYPRGPTHVLLSQLREAGVTATAIGDVRLLEVVVRHSRMVEKMTRRSFGPRFARQRFDGPSGPTLLLVDAIIALEAVRVSSALDVTVGDALLVENEDLKVFSRHLSQGLLAPDDRDNPRIEFASRGDERLRLVSVNTFVPGSQNIIVDAVWGYTEPGDAPAGTVPELVERAVFLMTLRDLPSIVGSNALDDVQKRWKLLGDRAKGDGATIANPRRAEPANSQAGVVRMTDVPEIDLALSAMIAPARIGWA